MHDKWGDIMFGFLHRINSDFHKPRISLVKSAFSLMNVLYNLRSFSLVALISLSISEMFLPYEVSASPYSPLKQEITSARIQLALRAGKINELISMIAQTDQRIADLEQRVEATEQNVDVTIARTQAAQESAQIAAVSYKAASAEQIKTEHDVVQTKMQLSALLQHAYMNGVSPEIIDILVTDPTAQNNLLDESSILHVLVHQAQQKYQILVQLSNESVNSFSMTKASQIQATITLKQAQAARRGAEKSLAAAISAVNATRDQRRELELQRSLAQAAYDSAKVYSNNLTARMQSYAYFQQKLASRLVKAAGIVTTGKTVQIRGAQTPTVQVLARIMPIPLTIPGAQILSSIPFVKDLPFLGLLTGSKSIDPLRLAADSVSAFVQSSTHSGNLVDNVINGAVKAVEVPANELSESLGLGSLGIPRLDPAPQQGASAPVSHPFLQGNAAVEAVVARGLSAVGTPYSWGGGGYDGPTNGVHDGGAGDYYGDYKHPGFDCSSLMQYAFAAAGVRLRRWSGWQYNEGTKVPLAQMKRGDMIFYGPGGGEHVALILGDGNQLEAPESGEAVHVTPVRTAGAEPYVVRMFP